MDACNTRNIASMLPLLFPGALTLLITGTQYYIKGVSFSSDFQMYAQRFPNVGTKLDNSSLSSFLSKQGLYKTKIKNKANTCKIYIVERCSVGQLRASNNGVVGLHG